MRQKGFAPILIILVVLIAIGGAYYFGTQKNKVLPTPTQISTPTDTSPATQTTATTKPAIDPTASWKTYTNNTFGYSFKMPSNWVNYSMVDFSAQELTGNESSLYIGPKETKNKPPQLMQLTAYKISDYREQEVFSQCTSENIKVGPEQILATRKTCVGMESYGFITIKTGKYVFVIDELKGTMQDRTAFSQILSTFKFTN